MEVIVMNEGISFDVKDKKDAVKAIMEEYHRFDIGMGELLDSLELRGFSIDDVVDIYAKLMNMCDNDKIVHIREGEEINRWAWHDGEC